MPPRDGRDLARILLKRADDDLTLVRHVAEDPDIVDAIVGFHAQQAVEKSIKAVLAARDIEYGRPTSSTSSPGCWRQTASTRRLRSSRPTS